MDLTPEQQAELMQVLVLRGYEEKTARTFTRFLRHLLQVSAETVRKDFIRRHPLKADSSAAVHLDAVVKAAESLNSALSVMEKDDELAARLGPYLMWEFESIQAFTGYQYMDCARKILSAAQAASDSQKATTESEGGLLPVYRGRRAIKAESVAAIQCVWSACTYWLKDVEPKKKAKDSDLFRTLVSITLGQTDPTRTIDAMIGIGAFKYKKPHIPMAGDF